MVSNTYIALDFGTTSCRVARLASDGGPTRIDDPELLRFDGRSTLSSSLSAFSHTQPPTEESELTVKIASKPKHKSPLDYKRRLQNDPEARIYTSRMFEILRSALTETTDMTNSTLEKHQFMLGIPVHWSAQRREYLTSVAKDSGFHDLDLVPEPFGPILYHLFARKLNVQSRPELISVVDIGGGFSQVSYSLMARNWVRPKLIDASGQNLGGLDFDKMLRNYILDRHWHGQNLTPDDVVQLTQYTRRFKERFSFAMSRGDAAYEQICGLPDFDSLIRLSRKDFESTHVAGNLINRFEDLIFESLRNRGLDRDTLSWIILCGGSSRWYFVRDILRKALGDKPVIIESQPDISMVKGLTLYHIDPKRRTPTPKLVERSRGTTRDRSLFEDLRRRIAQHGTTGDQVDQAAVNVPPNTGMSRSFSHHTRLNRTARTGGVILFILFLIDVFLPGIGATPVLPDLTCFCGLPIWALLLLVAHLIDRNNRNDNND